MLRHEVKRMENGYYALFMQTGVPAFYLLARRGRQASDAQ